MTRTMDSHLEMPSAYRDPSGFVFRMNGQYYRQVNQSYAADYEHLFSSGLYQELTRKKWLIPHEEITDAPGTKDRYKTILPEQIPVISYPYEWSPQQLQDAGLLTLSITRAAIEKGMILKDATPFNIQFLHGKPIFIDTLSLELYDPAKPWIAYRQFCESFLFPLYLQHYQKGDVDKLAMAYPEGIPAALTARLLPSKSRWKAGVWMHVLLQSKIQKDYQGSNKPPGSRSPAFSKTRLSRILEHLENILKTLTTGIPQSKGWSNYYDETILSAAYLDKKEKLFCDMLESLTPASALDLGANNGHFSRLLAAKNIRTIAVDADWRCIGDMYQQHRKNPVGHLLPLCIDLCYPTPDMGWLNKERPGFIRRAHSELVIALALVHHLALQRNIPLSGIADLLAALTGQWLIIEFVPLSDIKAQTLVENKNRYHPDYGITHFETCFSRYFNIEKKELIGDSGRILYRMKKLSNP